MNYNYNQSLMKRHLPSIKFQCLDRREPFAIVGEESVVYETVLHPVLQIGNHVVQHGRLNQRQHRPESDQDHLIDDRQNDVIHNCYEDDSE